MGDEKRGVLKEKWIEISLGFSTSAASLVEMKQLIKKYADELDWSFKEDKKGFVSEKTGNILYPMEIFPRGRMICPEELEENYDKIVSFAESLASKIVSPDKNGEVSYVNHFGFDTPLMSAGKKEEVQMIFQRFKTLNLRYPLYKRVELEKADSGIAKDIFMTTARDEINKLDGIKTSFWGSMFDSGETKDKRRLFQERLKDWFGIRIGEFEKYWICKKCKKEFDVKSEAVEHEKDCKVENV